MSALGRYGPFLLGLGLLVSGCGGTGLDLAPLPTSTPRNTPVAPAATPTRVLGVGIVARTGGDNVFVRSLPSNAPDARTEAWPPGTKMEIVGEDLEAAGRRWMKVKDPKGGVGFVPAEFMITATPTRTPVVTPTPPSTAVPTQAPTQQAATQTPIPAAPTNTAAPGQPATGTPTPFVRPTGTPVPAPTQPPATAAPIATATPLPTAAATVAGTPTPDRASAKLELVSATESKSTTFATVEGYVRNISNGSFQGVTAVVQYFSADGQPLAKGSAAIANNLLGPTQSSYFKCLVPSNPGMARFTVTFTDQAGQVIPSIDSR